MIFEKQREFYEAQKHVPSHIAGYALTNAVMGIGAFETMHGVYYGLIKGELDQPFMSWFLGPIVFAAGYLGTMAYQKYALPDDDTPSWFSQG